MRFIIQRVKEAKVTVNQSVVGEIDKGILVLVGFSPNDIIDSIPQAAEFIVNLKLWEVENGKENEFKHSVSELDLGVLVVSQFTLYSVLKGNKPDFHNAMNPDKAIKLYDSFIDTIKSKHKKISTGIFGAMMDVSLVNDGPVTLSREFP